MMNRFVYVFALCVCGLVAPARSFAQLEMMQQAKAPDKAPNVKVPDFDVISVKEHKADDGRIMMRMMPNDTQLSGITLKNLTMFAYGLQSEDQVSGGPEWMESKRWNVEAKTSAEDADAMKKLSREERQYVMGQMLQKLLTERFAMKTHRETKIAPVYELVVAKGGPKMKETPAETAPTPGTQPRFSIRMGPGEVSGDGLAMTSLIGQLTRATGRPVVDKTGLTGRYTINLKWTPERAAMAAQDNGAEHAPDIYTAVQEQLGLKLQPAKGQVEAVVVDDARMPSAD